MRVVIASLLAIALLVPGCASSEPTAEEKKKLEEDLAPQDVDPNAPPPELGKVKADPTKPVPPGGPASDELPPDADGTVTKLPKGAEDEAKRPGVAATILYVMEVADERPGKAPGAQRPAAMIFSSDPSNEFYDERPRKSRIVKHLLPHQMLALLSELDAAGLARLPLEEEPKDKLVEAGRAFHVFRAGEATRRSVKKSDLRDDEVVAFTRIEKKLIAAARNSR